MRVFVHFEDDCETFDVPSDLTVRAMKQMVKENFLVQIPDDRQTRHDLELRHGGAALQDDWTLCDVGIASGGAIRCLIKKERRPVMHVLSAVTGETFPITGSENLLHRCAAQLKTAVSVQCGLPVGSFRLSTMNHVQLYDCNALHDYAIGAGTTIRLDPWDGWVEFLQCCLLGQRLAVQSHMSEEKLVMRFQQRVALYVAASLGHLDLAGWLLDRGAHAEEPVGVHPYRQWCHQTAHRDAGKSPVHAAAESSQLLILKLFITKNPLALICPDPDGSQPLKIALQCGHRDCVRYLANKLSSVVSLPNVSLPMRVYLQMKHWMRVGQKRAAFNHFHAAGVPVNTRPADVLLVDGFNQPRKSSKSIKAKRGTTTKVVPPVPPITDSMSASYSKSAQPHPPSMQLVFLADHRYRRKPDDERINVSNILTSSVESIKQSCGRSPRENAAHYLSIASAFTEKPWSKQLSIARTLARKNVRSIASCS